MVTVLIMSPPPKTVASHQQFCLTVENANARWTINFMTSKSVKITIEILNVHRHMHYGLRTVDHQFRAVVMGQFRIS